VLYDGSFDKRPWDAKLTVPARLDRSFNIANTLDGDAVLIIPVDVLVLELANFVKQDSQLVRHVGHVFVTVLAPDRELLLRNGMLVVVVMVVCYSDTL